ncbi:MAG: PfkB family carbohydrate kinase [Waddliaceae bacterium]
MERLAKQLNEFNREILEGKRETPRCFIGFDGFTDEIISVVKTRESYDSYLPYEKMSAFGKTITEAAGKSCNMELVTKKIKLGGNAPILCNSLLNGGHHIYFAGCIGKNGEIEALFQPISSRCQKVWSLGASALTDALEFNDGKVILGKHHSLRDVTYENCASLIGTEEWAKLLDTIDLFVSANWTMLPLMTDIWEKIVSEIIPKFRSDHPRYMFVDLADPAKRSDNDLRNAVNALKAFMPAFSIVFGLNKAEAERIAKVLGIPNREDPGELAKAIREKTNFSEIVIHSSKFAVLSCSAGEYHQKTRYNPKPVVSTGAGDNFNAGYCNALLYHCSYEDRLLSAVANSGYYVSHGKSPEMLELAEYLLEWQAEEKNDAAENTHSVGKIPGKPSKG